jgi:Ser/Thr protein kinase RdoA (MazF antagonist)
MPTHPLQDRINYSGDLTVLISSLVREYSLGKLESFRIVESGYEDLNVSVYTNLGNYFLKIFEKDRTKKLCTEYLEKMQAAIKAGIPHPKLHSCNGSEMFEFKHSTGETFACLMEYIEGGTFYELGTHPTEKEMVTLAQSAAKISTLNLKSEFFYDPWAITSFTEEFKSAQKILESGDLDLIRPIAEQVKELDLRSIPKSFIHGDII